MSDSFTISDDNLTVIGDIRSLLVRPRPPSAGERRQLALMQMGVAADAIRAGDYGAAAIFLADAEVHLRALREAR